MTQKRNQETNREARATSRGNVVILRAIHTVMEQVPFVRKSAFNEDVGYAYASEADVLSKVRPALLRAGLILIPTLAESPRVEAVGNGSRPLFRATVMLEFILAHRNGAVWPERLRAAGCAIDGQDKMVAKAITHAHKMFLLKFFFIETGEDPDAGSRIDRQASHATNYGAGNRKAPRSVHDEGATNDVESGENGNEAESDVGLHQDSTELREHLKSAIRALNAADDAAQWWKENASRVRREVGPELFGLLQAEKDRLKGNSPSGVTAA